MMLNLVKYKIIILTALLPAFRAVSQPTRIDELKNNIAAATVPEKRLSAILAFCDEWESFGPDTLYKYAKQAKQLSSADKKPRQDILCDFYLTAWLFQKNKLDSAFVRIEDVIVRYKASYPYDEMYVKLYGLKGNILNRTAKLNELMAHNFELIKLAEEKKDTLGMARGTIGIGNVNSKLKKYDEALQWYHKALALMNNPVYKGKLSFVYNNSGIVFYHLQNEDSALFYIREGLKYSREGENLTDLANALFLYGGLLSEYRHLAEAENSFKEAIEIRKKIGDIYYLVTDMGQLAFFYADNKETNKGIALCKEAIDLAGKNGPMYSNMSSLYEVLGKNYLVAGDYKNYSESLNKQLALKDSIYKINSAEQMAELQTRFEVEQKDATIANQKLKLIRRNLLVYGSLLLFILAATAGWFVFRSYRRRQKLRMENALEQERKRIAADLHDNLGVQANAMLYNIELLKEENTGKDELVGDLHDTAKEMLLNLRETLWAMKTSDIMAVELWLRIISFCKQMGRHYTMIKFATEGNLPPNVIMPSTKALNVVMMIQEAVNNAVKHSGASQVTVKSNIEDGWKLRVTDNGHGFDMQKALDKNDSHGLRNMQERAKTTGLSFDIETNRESGTVVSIGVTG